MLMLRLGYSSPAPNNAPRSVSTHLVSKWGSMAQSITDLQADTSWSGSGSYYTLSGSKTNSNRSSRNPQPFEFDARHDSISARRNKATDGVSTRSPVAMLRRTWSEFECQTTTPLAKSPPHTAWVHNKGELLMAYYFGARESPGAAIWTTCHPSCLWGCPSLSLVLGSSFGMGRVWFRHGGLGEQIGVYGSGRFLIIFRFMDRLWVLYRLSFVFNIS